MQIAVPGQDIRHQRALSCAGDAYGQAGDLLFFVGNALQHVLVQSLDAFGIFKGDLALGGEFYASFRAVEQSGTQLFFQLSDMLADRRLRQRELFGGFGEAARLADSDEGFQFIIDHIHSPFPMRKNITVFYKDSIYHNLTL